MFVEGF